MRSYSPDNKNDLEEAEELRAQPWMLRLLDVNPSYVYWGPREDYMVKRNDGWESPIEIDDWKTLDIQLDELNEIVNFYFYVWRDAKACSSCEGGYSKQASALNEAFLKNSDITLEECRVLVEQGRLRSERDVEKREWKTPIATDALVSQVNAANDRRFGAIGFGGLVHGLVHDAINRHIIVKHRCERLGVPYTCSACEGRGHVYIAEKANVGLVLWLIHPRKSASRGVDIKLVEQSDVPKALAFLKQAADRNAERFAKVSIEPLAMEAN